ncbi:MAG: isopentenyl phosphate kinase [Thermoplasmata archaeon]
MILVKLGGSVITNKESYTEGKGRKIFFRKRAERLLGEAGSTNERLILVNGAGSFGHPLAKKYGLDKGYRSRKQIPAIARVQEDVRTLNLYVVQAMRKRGFHPISLSPSSMVELEDGKVKVANMEPFRHYLRMGMVPVTFGDVVPDVSRRFGICSGDDMMLQLSKEFKPRIAIFVTSVDGIFTKDPRDVAEPAPEFLPVINKRTIKLIRKSRGRVADVTGRMERKARMMLKIADAGVDCIVLNGRKRGRLRRAVKGEKVRCTIARGGRDDAE